MWGNGEVCGGGQQQREGVEVVVAVVFAAVAVAAVVAVAETTVTEFVVDPTIVA